MKHGTCSEFLEQSVTKMLDQYIETVRILWDMAFMAVGFLLGGTMGIVTVAVAFFCGPVVARVQRKLERIIA